MNKRRFNIWGREFELEVILQTFSDSPATREQNEMLDKVDKLDYSDSLEEIKKYIIKYNSPELGNDSINNIFRYVIPKRVFITQSSSKTFAIMCNYKFDMEHGLAVVYEGEKFKEVGPQDVIL